MTEERTRTPPDDRFCDLVMKGGIASGIVYPLAIDKLARDYHFHSIGGTSAGAIAAAVTAAAEYQRRCTGSRAGFERLAELPSELGSAGTGGASRLLRLFQPQPRTRRLFRVLIAALNKQSAGGRIAAVVAGFLRAYWPATVAGLVLATLLGAWAGWLAGALSAILAIAVLVGLWVYRDLSRGVVGNGYGLCTGLNEPGCKDEALTPWLHHLIQQAAGRGPDDPPLTFGELWRAPGFPPPWLDLPPDAESRSIDLQMFTTNLAHGRPYIFPLEEGDPSLALRTRDRLFFRPDELARYLPAPVLQWMQDQGRPYQPDPGEAGQDPEQALGQGLLELPRPGDLPVLLATRMSLSFPLLFSAVPLWAIDYDLPRGRRRFRRCWFSDGGISSNFPIHLFDSLLPRWPTFGISLEPKNPDRDNMVFLPAKYSHGYGERWHLFDENADDASRFGGFLGAIATTMQNWNDNTLSRMPGVRDRVVRLRLNAHEGGMNLNMEADTIGSLAERGRLAACELVQRFAPESAGAPPAAGWDAHRMVRMNVLLKMIESHAPGLVRAVDSSNPHATDFYALIRRAGEQTADGYAEPLTADQVEALSGLLRALVDDMATLAAMKGDNLFVAMPRPELRVRPPL